MFSFPSIFYSLLFLMMAVAVLPASLSVDLLKSTGFKSKCRLRVAAACARACVRVDAADQRMISTLTHPRVFVSAPFSPVTWLGGKSISNSLRWALLFSLWKHTSVLLHRHWLFVFLSSPPTTPPSPSLVEELGRYVHQPRPGEEAGYHLRVRHC